MHIHTMALNCNLICIPVELNTFFTMSAILRLHWEKSEDDLEFRLAYQAKTSVKCLAPLFIVPTCAFTKLPKSLRQATSQNTYVTVYLECQKDSTIIKSTKKESIILRKSVQSQSKHLESAPTIQLQIASDQTQNLWRGTRKPLAPTWRSKAWQTAGTSLSTYIQRTLHGHAGMVPALWFLLLGCGELVTRWNSFIAPRMYNWDIAVCFFPTNNKCSSC